MERRLFLEWDGEDANVGIREGKTPAAADVAAWGERRTVATMISVVILLLRWWRRLSDRCERIVKTAPKRGGMLIMVGGCS